MEIVNEEGVKSTIVLALKIFSGNLETLVFHFSPINQGMPTIYQCA
jgi:hypothetical protein